MNDYTELAAIAEDALEFTERRMSRSEYKKKRRDIDRHQASKDLKNLKRGKNVAGLTATTAGVITVAGVMGGHDRGPFGARPLGRRSKQAVAAGLAAYIAGLTAMATDKKNRKNRRDYFAKRQALKNRYLDGKI